MADYCTVEGEVDSFADRLAGMDCGDLIAMATTALGNIICRGTQQLGTGVGYSDVGNLVSTATIREILWPNDMAERLYHPPLTATQQYHLDLMEDTISGVISEMFLGSNRTSAASADGRYDAILWRTIVALVIETAQAISTAGAYLRITEPSLMCYEVHDAHPAATREGTVPDAYIYVITMHGP